MAEPRAGTAYADGPDARATAAQAASAALERAGGGDPCLVFCFHHGRLDPEEVRAGVLDALGQDARVVGGTAMGVIANDAVGYEGHQVGVAVITGSPQAFRVAGAEGLASEGERSVGARLGRALAAAGEDVLLLYSSIRTGLTDPGGLSLWFGTPLLEGFKEGLGDHGTLAGAGLIDSLQPSTSHVFAPDGILRDGAVAVGMGDGVRMQTTVLHGCRPAGAYHEITRTEGPVVLEIDGRPALDVVDDLMGEGASHEDYPFRVILGVNRGDRFGPFDPADYQTRLCLAVDPQRRALIMFEPDLEPGSKVQLMRIGYDLSYIGRQVEELVEELDGRRPLLALYADCAGRSKAASPLEQEEGDAVRAAIGDIPLLGFYTGVEIGRVGDEVRPLDWTGVLCLLSA